MTDILVNGLKELGISEFENKIKLFRKYKELLVSWNEKVNLTAITDDEGIAIKHFLDSLVITGEDVIKKSAKVIDVGTGAGFPGIPIKLIRDDINLTLLDSLNKRLVFLNEVINELGLNTVSCIHMRAEDGGNDKTLRETFDVAVSRAVSNMSTLTEYCLPFVKIGGVFLAYKSGSSEEELDQAKNAINILGGKIDEIRKFTLPNSDLNRDIIIVRKVRQTPSKYPRQGGKPSKSPIL